MPSHLFSTPAQPAVAATKVRAGSLIPYSGPQVTLLSLPLFRLVRISGVWGGVGGESDGEGETKEQVSCFLGTFIFFLSCSRTLLKNLEESET